MGERQQGEDFDVAVSCQRNTLVSPLGPTCVKDLIAVQSGSHMIFPQLSFFCVLRNRIRLGQRLYFGSNGSTLAGQILPLNELF